MKVGGHMLYLIIFIALVFIIPLIIILFVRVQFDDMGDLLIFPVCGYMIFSLFVYMRSWRISLDDCFLVNSEPEKWNQFFPKFVTSKIEVKNIKKVILCRVSSLCELRKKEHKNRIVCSFDPIMMIELEGGKSSLFRLKPFSTKNIKSFVKELKNKGIEVLALDNLI